MSLYHIRLDTSLVSDIVDKLVSSSTEACWVQEGKASDNPHVHMMAALTVPVQTARNWIRASGLKGNGSYSLKLVKDRRKLMAYLHKEGLPKYKGIGASEIEQALGDVENFVEESRKKKSSSAVPAILALLKDPASFSDVSYYYDHVKSVILQYHLDNELLVRRFQCQAYYDTIILRVLGKGYLDYIFRN
nr:rep protein [Cressdnaviricota sp.]UOF79571.1 rep protein [Cressdnaviricota sp.]UOF79757.1 rep protein [Cressdnaviricota sp.]UOF80155.1 rep protein [Cressdnaviricota sp.]UOF82714.1 rep protein [Cressdnaviricota sp.]